MPFDREGAKAAGYSDAEIDAYLMAQTGPVNAPAARMNKPYQDAPDEPLTSPDPIGNAVAIAQGGPALIGLGRNALIGAAKVGPALAKSPALKFLARRIPGFRMAEDVAELAGGFGRSAAPAQVEGLEAVGAGAGMPRPGIGPRRPQVFSAIPDEAVLARSAPGEDLGQIIAAERQKAAALREALGPPPGTARARVAAVTKRAKKAKGAPGKPKKKPTGSAKDRLELVKQNPKADAEMRARKQRGASKATLEARAKALEEAKKRRLANEAAPSDAMEYWRSRGIALRRP